MQIQNVGPFTGLDVRRLKDASDPKTLRVATNVDLTLGGGVKRRDGFRLLGSLEAQSKGLYSLNGALHAIIPSGQSLANSSTIGGTLLMYDAIGNGAAYPTSDIQKVTAVEGYGANAALGIYPYVVVQRLSGVYEHHWCKDGPVAPATVTNTKINLPFNPGASLAKVGGKLWAPDNLNGAVWYSSVSVGPTQWAAGTGLDSGYLAVITQAVGDRTIQALGVYDDKLAVMFPDSIQLWHVEGNPAASVLERVMRGPGTQARNSVKNVRGDLFYFSQGGFNNLSTVAITGQIVPDDAIGAPIYELTKALDPTTTDFVAVWSQARGMYMCAVGTTIYVYRNSPKTKVTGWTTYTVDAAVDYLVEHNSQLYARCGNSLYVFDSTYSDGSTHTVQTQFLSMSAPNSRKIVHLMQTMQTGKATTKFYVDPSNSAYYATGPTVSSTTVNIDPIPVGVMCYYLSLQFTGTSSWQLDGLSLQYDKLRM